jgi:hypothetical protein
MLSNENPNPNTQTIDSYRQTLDEIQARHLASRLVKFEHNPDPREAQNPNAGIRIRVWKPFRYLPVPDDVKEQNSNAASLGHPELFAHLWGGKK